MIRYYQELLNEFIDLTENKRTRKSMLFTLETMKNKMQSLKGGKEYVFNNSNKTRRRKLEST